MHINLIILEWIQKIHPTDYSIVPAALGRSITVGNQFAKIQLCWSTDQKLFFKAMGSPFLLAMMKWLYSTLQKTQLPPDNVTITSLVQQFQLPDNRRSDALLILKLLQRFKASR